MERCSGGCRNRSSHIDLKWCNGAIGAYDGNVTFYEPMITRVFLAGKPNICVPINPPQAWAVAGHYPTTYCIRHIDGEGRIAESLEKFVARSAN